MVMDKKKNFRPLIGLSEICESYKKTLHRYKKSITIDGDEKRNDGFQRFF